MPWSGGRSVPARRLMVRRRKVPLGVTIRDHHGIYFAGYNLPSLSDEQPFLEAWERAAAPIRAQRGFLYQELYKQVDVPASDNRPPFDHVEYTVFDSLEGLEGAAGMDNWAAARAVLSAYEVLGSSSGGIYKVAIRVARSEPEEEELVALNLLEIESEGTMKFVAAVSWPRRVEFQSSRPGFLSATLHRSVSPESRFALFNRAEWSSAGSLVDAERRMEGAFPVAPTEREHEVKVFQGIFKVLRRYHSEEEM